MPAIVPGVCVCYRSRKLVLHLLEGEEHCSSGLSFPVLSETAVVPPLRVLRMPKMVRIPRMPKMPRHRLFLGFLLLALPWGS